MKYDKKILVEMALEAYNRVLNYNGESFYEYVKANNLQFGLCFYLREFGTPSHIYEEVAKIGYGFPNRFAKKYIRDGYWIDTPTKYSKKPLQVKILLKARIEILEYILKKL